MYRLRASKDDYKCRYFTIKDVVDLNEKTLAVLLGFSREVPLLEEVLVLHILPKKILTFDNRRATTT